MADHGDGSVQSKQSRTVIVRHLPADLTREEKEDLLKYFGAGAVRVLSERGVLKHTAFATFDSEASAAKALNRLHQLKVLGHTLVVEFAREQESVTVLKDPPVTDGAPEEKDGKGKKSKLPQNVPLIETGVAPNLGLKFQANPTLKYLYPPPSNAVVTNITHALLSVPKFYVQVLHLMNKMNLPCPFGPLTPRPPMFEMYHVPAGPVPPPYPPENPPLPTEGTDASEEESEYESEGDEEEKERMVRLMGLVNQPCKRPARTKAPATRKKPKLKDLLYAPKPEPHSATAPVLQASDVFEQPQALGPKKIEFHIPPEVSSILEAPDQAHQQESEEEREDNTATPKWRVAKVQTAETDDQQGPSDEVADGFGKIYPAVQAPPTQEEDSGEEEDIPSDFISRKELDKGRLSRDEMKRMSVFKNYEPGEVTCRLYVKNIAKQVEEKDLKYVYGRYIDITSEAERNMFDIVLMKEGRMKGQAFIGLPSEKSAEKALRDTNGYVLNDKPLVVQFARSARPKQDAGDTKKPPKRS
ncbi:RNA-binding region-containing protein 3 isoform X1 [Alosa alosa]|nr:RNA-binding region-containing protein 3 isoform X1 [Alosa sapidissima]XP_041924321.1 RNA-binding region-containing protein 3 isoform X1 [Alosa sapidissima]XP_048122103.1 RNA-binding region-containing protein 3 isoform X1 [Alosa alosa]XP_048122104.1 RNA-binding region-containing protein 3 isoform X1 [Alosa alosa]